MNLRASLALLCSLIASPVPIQAASEAPAPPPSLARPENAQPEAPRKIDVPGVKLTHGPATVKLGTVAELKLPDGYAFVGPDSLDKFFELTRNLRGGKEVGVLLSPDDWVLYFDYDDVGYVKDDDKDKLQADKLYQSLEEGVAGGNESRRSRGWDELKLQGWATQPHYDEKTNNLKWAFKLSSSRDQFQSVGINESIRLLGRGGVMNLTLVTGTENFKASEAAAEQLLTGFAYVSGQKYAEFTSGDKVAKYGLAALVVGGAGAIALKTGLLAYLGKFWKFVAAGVVVLGVGIQKIWKKITGRDER